jgi:hypothetical protein
MKSVQLFAAILTAAVMPCAAQNSAAEPEYHHSTRSGSIEALPSRHPILHVKRPLPEQAETTGGFDVNAATATVPFWQAKDGSYSYQMVGTDPTSTNTTTSVPVPIVPVILTFSDGTVFDPTIAGSCAAQSPANLLLGSPLFSNSQYTVGGTNVGNTQFGDFFQRANFWSSVKTNPAYHILLAPTLQAPLKITVPAASGRTVAARCGRLGEMDINFIDGQISAAFNSLSATLTPATFPLFLIYNVVMYQNRVTNCCILGYHSAFNNPNYGNAVQTYTIGEYDTSGDFGNTTDSAVLTHEVAEWLDDPTGNNPTPAWGHTGQVSSCQGNLEVGDPLSGTIIPVAMPNGTTYHVQELAFKSWFYRDTPGSGVNGWYSSNGTFKTAAAPCGTSTTSLSITPESLSPGSTATATISVTGGGGASGVPTGTVALVSSVGGATLATFTLSGGTAKGTLQPPTGSYNITANYSGDSAFQGSSSSAVPMTVGAPAVTFSPVGLSFGNQNVASAGTAQTVTLSNKGTAALQISGITLTGASPGDFSQTNNCAPSMPVNTSCTISVVFKPTAAGTRTASVSVADNVAGSPQTVPVSGTGVAVPTAPKATLSATSLAFGSLAAGSTATKTVTLQNTGTAALTGIAITVAGANASELAQTSNCGPSLAVSATCTISVVFKPTSVASKTATLSIADNVVASAQSPSPQTVALSGTATAPAPTIASVTPTSIKTAIATTVTVNGANFQQGFTATFSLAKTAASLTFVSATKVTLSLSPTSTGAGVLTITNPDGQKVSTSIQVTK